MLPAVAPSAFAECPNFGIDPIDRVDVGAAFLATVTEVSDEVDPNPDGSAWDVHLNLSVDAVYYGHVPKALEFNDRVGWGCAEFRADLLEVGDRIIVAAEELALTYLPAAPFEGHIVVWKKAGPRWAFYKEAMAFGSIDAFYPGAPREARTKAEILKVIASWTLPETSTALAPPVPPSFDGVGFAAGAFALGLAIALWRFRHRTAHVTSGDAD
jgi:hypothetical protein